MSFEGNKEIMFTKIDVAAQSVTMDKSVKNYYFFAYQCFKAERKKKIMYIFIKDIY